MERIKGFTLVEILIVVVLLGILAAIVIPTVSQGAVEAKRSALISDVQLLRRFILVYKAQHLEVPPGVPNNHDSPEQAFFEQATMASNAEGQTATPGTGGYDRGPYLSKVPCNPFNGLNKIEFVEEFSSGDDSHGWQYKVATGQIRADTAGYEDY
ncbi:MAG: prepilin-type N-terminal cleavage/methylation domain-containing protein [Sedimentisphaerales bacterium]|nr:prepilin-type N-terminal cleavage/methylation domain-containing protein [Sedimentisphaerales bacterium]